ALADVKIQLLDGVERINAAKEEFADGILLRIEQRRGDQELAATGVDERLQRADVAQGLVGGIVVEAIELRQGEMRHVRVDIDEVGAEDDLVIDAVEVPQVALDIGIDAAERDAGADAAATPGAADRVAIFVMAVGGQVEQAVGNDLEGPQGEGQREFLHQVEP